MAVNQSLVLRNWLVGAYVVEFEQRGADRAKYGDSLMPRLAKDLTKRKLPGLGLSVLRGCRVFYQYYPQIGQSVTGFLSATKISAPAVWKSGKRQPPIGESGEDSISYTLSTESGSQLSTLSSQP